MNIKHFIPLGCKKDHNDLYSADLELFIRGGGGPIDWPKREGATPVMLKWFPKKATKYFPQKGAHLQDPLLDPPMPNIAFQYCIL